MDKESIFWVVHVPLLLILMVGLVRVILYWRAGMIKVRTNPPAPEQGAGGWLRIAGNFIGKGWFNRRLWKTNPWRALSHFLLLNGFILLAFLSAVSVIGELVAPLLGKSSAAALQQAIGRDQPVKALLNDLGSLMMSLGLLFYILRRYFVRPVQLRTNREDHWLLAGLGLILLTGWITEITRINAGQAVSPYSFIGYPLAGLAAELLLPWSDVFSFLYVFHGLLASAVLVTLPVSKLLHMLAGGITASLERAPAPGLASFSGFQRVGLEACTRCGECIPWCPTYAEKSNLEAITPLHKIEIVRRETRKQHGYLFPSQEQNFLPPGVLAEHARGVYDCTLCGRSAVVCPAHIETRSLWLSMRENLAGRGSAPERLGQLRNSISKTYNLSGDPGNERLAWSQNLTGSVRVAGRERQVEILYFTGCVASTYPQAFSIPQSLTTILDKVRLDYGVLGGDEWCCGFPLVIAGMREAAVALARHNLEAVRRSGAKMLVTGCPSCYRTWTEEYPSLLGEKLDIRIVHAAVLLDELIQSGRLRLKPLQQRVTYHDPCDLGRGSGVYEAPRRVIQAIPGVELVEMEQHHEYSLCCGGGGDVDMVDEGLSASVGIRRVGQARAVGADLLVTACQQCVRTLSTAAHREKNSPRVLDLTRLVAQDLVEV